MFAAKYVALAMSMSSQVNWACNFIIGLIFPTMNELLGDFSFAPFAVVLACTFVFTATLLPETQGTTPEALATELKRSLSQTVVYQPNADSASQIDLEWKKAMEQLQQEEERERQAGTFEYGTRPVQE